jgi:hypothetical protein
VASDAKQPSPRQKAWAEVVGEVGAVLLGVLLTALGFEFGYGLIVIGGIGLVVTLVRRRQTLLGRPVVGADEA